MSAAPSPWTASPSRRPGRLPCAGHRVEVAGEQDQRPVAARRAPGQHAGVAGVAAATPPARSTASTCAASAASSRDSDGMSTSSSVRAASRAARLVVAHAGRTMRCRFGMRYCGIDVSAKPGNQQLVHPARAPRARRRVELVATFYAPATSPRSPGPCSASAARRSSRSTRRPGGGWTSWPPGAPLRDALGLPDGRYERSRVCDALLFRRGLPLYPVPAAEQALARWERWMDGRLRAVRGAGAARAVPARGRTARVEAPGRGRARCASAGCARPTPTRSSARCSGHRPSPKRTPWGLQQRIAALRLRGVVDEDGGLWHRTLDELDACAAAYAAYALADGQRLVGGGPARGRDRPAGRRPARPLREAAAAAAADAGLGWLDHGRPDPRRSRP